MSQPIGYTAREVFLQAEKFGIATDRLESQLVNNDIALTLSLPICVTCAFSIELYMKCLILLEGQSVERVHNLKKLFDRLRSESQQEIRTGYASWQQRYRALMQKAATVTIGTPEDAHSIFSSVALDFTIGRRPPNLWDVPFDDALEASANAFEYMRYFYESQIGQKGGTPKKIAWQLGGILPLMRRLILRRHPEWSSDGPK